VGHPGRGGAHGAPGRQPEERPRETTRGAKRSPHREQGDAEAGPVEDGKGRHGFLASLPSCIRRKGVVDSIE
jgi:hypothetical protein